MPDATNWRARGQGADRIPKGLLSNKATFQDDASSSVLGREMDEKPDSPLDLSVRDEEQEEEPAEPEWSAEKLLGFMDRSALKIQQLLAPVIPPESKTPDPKEQSSIWPTNVLLNQYNMLGMNGLCDLQKVLEAQKTRTSSDDGDETMSLASNDSKRAWRSLKAEEEGLFACDQCDKMFGKQSSLARHKYEHSGQ